MGDSGIVYIRGTVVAITDSRVFFYIHENFPQISGAIELSKTYFGGC